MQVHRELLATKAERLIELRKPVRCSDHKATELEAIEACVKCQPDGVLKLRRKRAPKGHVLKHQRELNTTTRYRTPMDDSGHLWEEDTQFFRCGRYVEYPLYYREGWDHFFGVYWVQVDARKEEGNICALCKKKRTAEEEAAEALLDYPHAKRPVQHRRKPVDQRVAVWLGKDRTRRLHIG